MNLETHSTFNSEKQNCHPKLISHGYEFIKI